MPVQRVCAHCGKEFLNQRINNKPGKFCSRFCANQRSFNLSYILKNKTRINRDCLEWTGATQKGGYAGVSIGGQNYLLHRLVWESVNGPIPDGLVIRHKCNNPPCLNIGHLRLGTQADNIQDRDESGHTTKGQDHYLAVLTNEDVLTIIGLKGVEKGTVVAKYFGVTKNTIYSIWRGETWKHLSLS